MLIYNYLSTKNLTLSNTDSHTFFFKWPLLKNLKAIAFQQDYLENWDMFKIHPVKFENRLPIEGKGLG